MEPQLMFDRCYLRRRAYSRPPPSSMRRQSGGARRKCLQLSMTKLGIGLKHLKTKSAVPAATPLTVFPSRSTAGTVDDMGAMTERDAENARSGYRVRLTDGKWHDVPNFALINPKSNKLGYAVVWLRGHQ